MRRLLFSLSLLCMLCQLQGMRAYGQYEAAQFRLHSVKTGLSNNYVTCVEQDELGYIWIGTDDGLNRFDGSGFTHYGPRTRPLSVASGFIRNMKKLADGRLAVVSRAGLQVVNTRNFTVDHYAIPDTTAFVTQLNAAWDAMELPDGGMALTTGAGFYVFDAQKQLVFRKDAFRLQDVGRTRIFYGRYMLMLSPGHLSVFVGEHGLAHYDIRLRKFEEFTGTESSPYNFSPARPSPQRGLIHHLALSANETLFLHFAANRFVYYHSASGKNVESPLPLDKEKFSWESKLFRLSDSVYAINGGYSGFYTFRIDRNTGNVLFDTTCHLPAYKIHFIKSDTRGKLWIGTSQGLLQQSESSHFISTIHYPPAADDPAGKGFSCVYRYRDELFVGGNSYRNGLVVMDARTRTIRKRLHFFNGSSDWNEVYSIERYHGDTLFLGTGRGILWLDSRSLRYGKLAVPATVTKGLNVLGAPGSDGYAWMCSLLNGIVVRYHIPTRSFTVFTPHTQPALPFSKVKRIVTDSYGDVWLGGHSLARWNSRKQVFDTLITVYGGENRFNEDIVLLYADQQGSLWMHNTENGLMEYRIAERRWVKYGIREGLPSESLQAMSGVIDNKIWLGTAAHLSCFDLSTHKIAVYDFSDGYPEEGPREKQIYADTADRQLYLLARMSVTSFPSVPTVSGVQGANILLQEVKINNERSLFHPEGAIVLPYNENNLSLHFSVIDYENSHYRFQYRWTANGDWISLNETRSINLPGLSPGEYTLFLKATGKWGALQERQVLIRIGEPWWSSRIFLAGVLLLLLLTGVFVYRYRIRVIRSRANLDRQLAHSEMMALHAQMNPHFISNSLNSIREMILNNENRDASRYLTKFAHLIRITLEQSLKPFVPLRHTMDYINRYAEMEMIRNSKFRFSQTVSEDLDVDEVILPPMLIQPFIENSIWHGAESGVIDIRVAFRKEGGQLVCVVEDDGIGIRRSLELKSGSPSMHQSVGLDNIRNRIRLLNEKYGMQSKVDIEDRGERGVAGERGTRVIIQLPIKTFQ